MNESLRAKQHYIHSRYGEEIRDPDTVLIISGDEFRAREELI